MTGTHYNGGAHPDLIAEANKLRAQFNDNNDGARYLDLSEIDELVIKGKHYLRYPDGSFRDDWGKQVDPRKHIPIITPDDFGCRRETAQINGVDFVRQVDGTWRAKDGRTARKVDRDGMPSWVIDDPTADDIIDLNPVNFGQLRVSAAELKPRGWVLGNWMCRQFISSILADGGGGKTALRIAAALAITTGRKDILGLHVFERVSVLFLCFEDGQEELYRRLKAAMKLHNVSDADIEGYLFVEAINNHRLKLVTENQFHDRAIGPLAKALDRAVEKIKAGGVILDPVVKIHDCDENDNRAMDMVAEALSDLAISRDCFIDIPQHVNKTAMIPGDANKGRGASATKDAGRLFYTLCGMSDEEAKTYDIDEEEQLDLMRADAAKTNITRKNAHPLWFRRIGVPLGNTWDSRYPAGDTVVAVETWTPPDPFDDFTPTMKAAVINKIRQGPRPGDSYSTAQKPEEDWIGQAIMTVTGKGPGSAGAIADDWRESSTLICNPNGRRRGKRIATGLMVNEAKAAEILGALYEPPKPTAEPEPEKPTNKTKIGKGEIKLPQAEQIALNILTDTLDAQGGGAITLEQWQDTALRAGFSVFPNPKTAFGRAVKGLIAKKLVRPENDLITLCER
jgi:hypothetical protein